MPAFFGLLLALVKLLHSLQYSTSNQYAASHVRETGEPSKSSNNDSSGHSADRGLLADLLADKLFDEREGHLDLLQGGHLLAPWFNGLAGPHQLHISHVTQLLTYLLAPPPPAAQTAAAAGHNDSQAASYPSNSAQSETPPRTSARLRGWASRLMSLIQHPHHPHAPTAAPPPPTATAVAQKPKTAADASAPAAKLLACSSDPLVASYRPLVFYLLTEAVAGATHLALLMMGFKANSTPKGTATVYSWEPKEQCAKAKGAAAATAAAAEESANEAPLVFLHGIGLGLTPYLRLLGRLVAGAGGRRRVFAVQYKHVSMRLTSHIPAPHQVAADVAEFLGSKGVSCMSLLAHSYGTLIASSLTKLAATHPAGGPAVSRLTLVDPVCFAMFLPHLVRNAIYQQPVDTPEHPQPAPAEGTTASTAPQSGQARGGLLRSLIKGLVVAEFHCSVALRRRLDWARVNLWPSELPPECTVVLSGRDNLVPVREVRRILANRAALVGPTAPHPTVLFHEHLGHGGFLINEDCQAQVLAASLDVPLEAAKATIAATVRNRRSRASGEVAASLAAPDGVAFAGVPAVISVASLERRVSDDGYALAAGAAVQAAVEVVWSQPLGRFFRAANEEERTSAAAAAAAVAAAVTAAVTADPYPPLDAAAAATMYDTAGAESTPASPPVPADVAATPPSPRTRKSWLPALLSRAPASPPPVRRSLASLVPRNLVPKGALATTLLMAACLVGAQDLLEDMEGFDRVAASHSSASLDSRVTLLEVLTAMGIVVSREQLSEYEQEEGTEGSGWDDRAESAFPQLPASPPVRIFGSVSVATAATAAAAATAARWEVTEKSPQAPVGSSRITLRGAGLSSSPLAAGLRVVRRPAVGRPGPQRDQFRWLR